jgi:hypothetical protein
MKMLQYLTIRVSFALAMLGNLTSCTPIEREIGEEIVEEVIEYECGQK